MYLPSSIDGFVKSPTSALRYILRFFKVRKVRIITDGFARLANFIKLVNFYTLPSKSYFF